MNFVPLETPGYQAACYTHLKRNIKGELWKDRRMERLAPASCMYVWKDLMDWGRLPGGGGI